MSPPTAGELPSLDAGMNSRGLVDPDRSRRGRAVALNGVSYVTPRRLPSNMAIVADHGGLTAAPALEKLAASQPLEPTSINTRRD